MSTLSESIPTPDQVQAGDTQAGVYDPNDPEGPPPQRRFLIGASIFIGYFVMVLLVAKFAPGTVGSIGRSMLRESLSAQTAAVAIAIIGLNVHFGYTGLLNMGQSGFMMLGALRLRDLDLERTADGGRHPASASSRPSCSH